MERLKRKPYLFGLVAVLIVIGAAAVRFARPSKAESPRLERYLPADTVGFAEVNDLRSQALKVIDSEAWRAFAKENQAASSLFMMAANHAGALDASYAVALLGAGANADGKPEPQFALVAEFNGAGARRTFENRVLRFAREAEAKGVTTKQEQYGDATINSVTPEGKRGLTRHKVTPATVSKKNTTVGIAIKLAKTVNTLETKGSILSAPCFASSRPSRCTANP